MNYILKNLKKLNLTFPKVNGQYKFNPVSPYGSLNLSNETIDFMREFYEFIINSKILSTETLIYIQSFEDTPKEVVQRHNENADEYNKITVKQLTNHIYYDTKRLHEFFDDQIIQNLIIGKGDLGECKAALQNAKTKKQGKSLLSELSPLKYPTAINTQQPSFDNIKGFIQMLTLYTHTGIEFAEQSFPDVVGYINYIASKDKSELTQNEAVILEKVKNTNKPRVTKPKAEPVKV